MENYSIRKIKKEDNPSVAALIRAVFDELNIPKVGTAYEDPYLDLMFEEYSKPKSVYFEVERKVKFWVVLVLHLLKMKLKRSANFKKCIFYQKLEVLELGAK